MTDNQCMYCEETKKLTDLMTFICKVDGFSLYLFKNQAYKARCVLAYNEHVAKIVDIEDDKYINYLMAIKKVSTALTNAFKPDQINLGFYADTVPHVHAHIVPKYVGTLDFGSTFQMNPSPVTLKDDEFEQIMQQIRQALI